MAFVTWKIHKIPTGSRTSHQRADRQVLGDRTLCSAPQGLWVKLRSQQ